MSFGEGSAKRALAALAAGLLMGLGLAISQMTNPAKVLNFLDVAGRWDPSLVFVLGAAVLVAAVCFPFVLRRSAPVLDMKFHLPTRTEIDRPLLLGAAVFGIGWGLGGYCPGPALASLATLGLDACVFVAMMIAGALVNRALG